MAEGPWFYCLKHHAVKTREDAEHALQSVADRQQKLGAEDRAWEGE